MEFGKFGFACTRCLLTFALVLLYGAEFRVAAQQAPSSSPVPAPVLPAAEPISQAAIGSAPKRADTQNAPASGASAGQVAPANENSSQLRLSPGDLLEVSIYNVPELATKARVGNSGDVYLPLIDYVHVGDLTVEEAQALIEKRLDDGGFVRNAHVTIFIDESAAQGVTVLGEVAKPGIYPALGDRRLYDIISAAGGFTASAGRKVSIIRQHSQGEPITVNLPRNLADDLQDNVVIEPGDTITIPRAPIIYVVGDVGHPAGFLVDNGSLTVLQALALAGGTNHTAKMGGVRIIHKSPTGMIETAVPLKKMLEAKAPDVNLQADDILFVPLSGIRYAAGTGLSAAMSAAAGLAIIAAHP
ncbi:MAG: polysaccharide biosynthesis/export family protein [Candidatus Sulfotelmatobacter sp.]